MMATQTNVWKTHIYYSQGKFIASALVHLKCGLVKIRTCLPGGVLAY